MTNVDEVAEQPKGVEPMMVQSTYLGIIEQFHQGQLSKGNAIYKFTKSITPGETESAESVGKTLESYVTMLNDWNQERMLSIADMPRQEMNDRTSPIGEDQGHKQVEEDEEDDTCDEPLHKQPKINTELFPWVMFNKIGKSTLRNECIATRDLITNHHLDIKLTKAHLLNTGSVPEFPNSEWKYILMGLTINLDAIFSGRYSTDHDPKVTQEFGDFTISTREIARSKSIKTASDWFITWNQAAATTTYAFPHHSKECQDYAKHILSLFTAFGTECCHLILNYDQAIQ